MAGVGRATARAAAALAALPAYLYVVDAGAFRKGLNEYLFGPPAADFVLYPVAVGFAIVFAFGFVLAAPALWFALRRLERVWPERFEFTKSLTSLVYLPIAALLGLTAGVQQLIALSQEPSVFPPHALLALLTAIFSLLLLLDTVSVVGVGVRDEALHVTGFPRAWRIPTDTIRGVRRERGVLYVETTQGRVALPAHEFVAVHPGEGFDLWDGPMTDPGRFGPLAKYLQGLVRETPKVDAEGEEAREAVGALAAPADPPSEPGPSA